MYPARSGAENEMNKGYVYEGDDWVQGGEMIYIAGQACEDCNGLGADDFDR
jgi:hypothetical protein